MHVFSILAGGVNNKHKFLKPGFLDTALNPEDITAADTALLSLAFKLDTLLIYTYGVPMHNAIIIVVCDSITGNAKLNQILIV